MALNISSVTTDGKDEHELKFLKNLSQVFQVLMLFLHKSPIMLSGEIHITVYRSILCMVLHTE